MKIEIKNRHDKKIVVLLDKVENQKGLAIVMHGLGGFKEQPHIQTLANTFLENNISVVRFDTTNSLGESDGDYLNAAATNYYEDLEDVISWAKRQDRYEKPFYLAGHSLGGLCPAIYAIKNPDKVKGLAIASTVVSGTLFLEEFSEEQITDGYWILPSKPEKKLKWEPFKRDLLKYDLLENADKLTMPVLIIVGENDSGTPPKHQRLLFNKLPGKKELHVIKDAPHTFKDERHLKEVKGVLNRWLENCSCYHSKEKFYKQKFHAFQNGQEE